MLRGSEELMAICRRRIHPAQHHLSENGLLSWEEVECLGACVNAPMIQVSKDTYEDLTPKIFEVLLDAFERGEMPEPGSQIMRQYSMPMSGPTTLTDIQYAADDIRSTARKSLDSAVSVAAAVSPREEEPRAGTAQRHGGTSPATPAAANQEVARVDPSGRADEAAARSPSGGAGGSPKPVADTHESGPKNPGARSDRDSSNPDGKGP
jgi:NADH-quinone oxidoreductase subunit E